MATQPITKLTEEEYLELDRANELRSEYIHGEMFAMSGGTARHSRLIFSCGFELQTKLLGSNCGVFSSDTRVRTSASNSYVYPDVSVVCGPVEFHKDTDDIITNPLLVVEVLSPSTKSYDKRLKFSLYREIPSLKEYLLFESNSVAVTHYSRQPDNSWIFREASGMAASLPIPALSVALELASIYEEPMKIPVRQS